MSSELEIRPDAQAPAVLNGSNRSAWAGELMSWAAAAQKAHEIATILCETSFVPKSMAHKPGDVCGAILTGMELGVPVMWALSNIDIVEGSPSIRARGMRGLALQHGHELWTEESNASRAIVCGRRKGATRIERSTWTTDRAKKAELLGKKNWRLYPTDMLLNRATAEVVRLIAPDVLMGVAYTADELGGDEAPVGAVVVADEDPPPPKRRSAKRAEPAPVQPSPQELPADIPAPPPDDPPTVVVSEAAAISAMEEAGFEVADVIDTLEPEQEAPLVQDAEPMMSDPQRKRMAVEMRQAGLIERGERLAFASDIVGRELSTSNDLTVAEASQVIQALVDLVTEQGLAAAQAASTGGE
jgi:hypothetical protein